MLGLLDGKLYCAGVLRYLEGGELVCTLRAKVYCKLLLMIIGSGDYLLLFITLIIN